MIETIQTRLLDLLQADPRLVAGGNAFADGWAGVVRVDDNNAPNLGRVNLFDEPYQPEADTARPALYIGMPGNETQDWVEHKTASGPKPTLYKIAVIPLVVTVHAETTRLARKMRNQLRGNIERILLDHRIEAGFWYSLDVAEGASEGRERMLNSTTGGAAQAVAEAITIIPVAVRYSFRADSPA